MKKVILGMSGGVDSSTAAVLLLEQGYDVIGVFMKNWEDTDEETGICSWKADYEDAKAVAEKIGVELHLVSFEVEYWERVFKNYFLEELKAGRTPNPDIFCNKEVKFKAFVDYCNEKFDYDYIATGHYARIQHFEDHSVMLRGLDNNKDQTYFLSQLSQKQISNVLFPVGHLEKPIVRQIAEEHGLVNARKKDSTGICFIGPKNYKTFLSNYVKFQPGEIINIENNKVMGTHQGLSFYTIGQAKGLGIGSDKDFHDKWFVVRKDIEKNILYIANGEENEYYKSTHLIGSELNFFNPMPDEFKCTAKFRYRQQDVEVTFTKLEDGQFKVSYDKRQKAVTPGQAVVFYDGEICLGGGLIDLVYNNNELVM